MSSQRRQPQRAAQPSRAVASARARGGPPSNAAQLDRMRAHLSPRAAQEVLARLGFGGEVADRWDPDRRAGLAAFQEALGLQPTGELDPITEAALQHAHLARVSFRELLAIAPDLEQRSALDLLPGVNTGMARADVSNAQRKAAFLAQLAQESAGFQRLDGGGQGLLPARGEAEPSPVAVGQAAAARWSEGGFNALADQGMFATISAQLGVPEAQAAELRVHVRDVIGRARANPGFFDALPPGVAVDEGEGPPLLWAENDLDESTDEQEDPARPRQRVPSIGDFL
ncbi:MAG: peptidoglycan-binding protein [Deltaproteobacteria bacterium]|nr:peptidoglycan-binding protein [Deltaproteobacteria bacterium]